MENRKTKKEIIYETLKNEIYNGDLKFNEKLVINSLAKRFNSSEIPVREAMSLLQSDELIEIKPHIGAIVKPLSEKDVRNILELRIELEGLATRLATERLTKEDLDFLRMVLDASIAAHERDEYDRFEELNIQFHNAIYKKSNNQLLTKTINDLWKNTNRYPSIFERNLDHIRKSINEHEGIYEAIVEKDSAKAEYLMIQHKVRAGKEILSVTQSKFYENLQEEIK